MQYQSIRLRHRQDLWLRDCTLITTAIRTSEGSVTDHYRYDADTSELYITPQSGDTDEHNKPGIVLEFAAENCGDDRPSVFRRLDDGRKIYWLNLDPNVDNDEGPGELYIPLHTSCLQLAKQVLNGRHRPIIGLCNVLRDRVALAMRWTSQFVVQFIEVPNDYFLPGDACWRSFDQQLDGPEDGEEVRLGSYISCFFVLT